MNGPGRLLSAAVIVGLAAYLAVFFLWPLPAEGPAAPAGWRRYHLAVLLLLPESLAEDWFGQPPQFALADRLPVLGMAGLIFAWATLLGRLLLKGLKVQHLPWTETFVCSAAAGLNLLSTWTLACGLAGMLGRWWVIGLPGAATLALGAWAFRRRPQGLHPGGQGPGGEIPLTPDRHAGEPYQGPPENRLPPRRESLLAPGKPERKGLARRGRSKRKSGQPAGQLVHGVSAAPPDFLSTRWLWLAAPFVAVIVLGGMLPPIDFDVREYHLQAPKEFFLQGRIGFVPHNLYANMALGTEMLSLLGMVLAGDWWTGALVGKTLVALYGPLGGLALWAIGRRWFSNTAGVVAALVYLSTGWIIQVSTLGLVEGASALYLLLAAYALLLGRRTPETGAAEARRCDPAPPQPAAGGPPAPQAATEWASGGLQSTPQAWLLLGGYYAGAAVAAKYPAVLFVVLPLTVWLAAGHLGRKPQAAWKPLALFLGMCALGCGLWFIKNAILAGNPTYPLMFNLFGGRTWTPEKNALWNQVHQPHDFSPLSLGSDLLRVYLGSAWLGPLVMPLATLAFLVRVHRRTAGLLAGYFGFVVLAWWFTALRVDRYWIPALPLVALLAGLGASWQTTRWWRRTLVGLLVATSLYNFVVATAGFGGYNRFFVPYARLREDPARVPPWHRYLNRHARDGRVLLVGDAQVFDLEMPVLYNTWLDDSIFEQLVKGRAFREVHQALRAHGITHVFVNWGEIERYRRTGYGRWDFVQPGVFHGLVRAGVLEPLAEIPGEPAQAYRVRP